jgi:leucyl-tRNA synthetase
MIHCKRDRVLPVPERDLPVLLPPGVQDFLPKGRSPLEDVPEFRHTTCPKCRGPAERDPDTMDTFVDSSWYFLRYCDPTNEREPFSKESVAAWGPVDVYVGGITHATMHLLYFRFVTKVLHDLGHLPFDEPNVRLFNQGMVLDSNGDVMSKSKGNVVSPAKLFDEWGVDASRVAMLFMGPSDWEIRWSEQGLVGAARFLDKVWDLVQDAAAVPWSVSVAGGAESAPTTAGSSEPPRGNADAPSAEAKDLRRQMHASAIKVTESMEKDFAFNTALSSLMELASALRRLLDRDSSEAPASLPTAADRTLAGDAVRRLVRLLAPMAPCLMEECWARLGGSESVFRGPWPEGDPALAAADAWEMAVQVNGKVRSRLLVTGEWSEEEIRAKALEDEKVRSYLAGKPPRRVVVIPRRLVNVVT